MGVGTATGFLLLDWEPVAPVPPLGALSLKGYRQSQARPLVNPYLRNTNPLGILLSTTPPGSARSVADRGVRPRPLLRVVRPVLAGRLEEQPRGRRGDIERPHPAPHGDGDQQIATRRHAAPQSSPLAAQDEDDHPGQVRARIWRR